VNAGVAQTLTLTGIVGHQHLTTQSHVSATTPDPDMANNTAWGSPAMVGKQFLPIIVQR
jgi:hypothetical protein